MGAVAMQRETSFQPLRPSGPPLCVLPAELLVLQARFVGPASEVSKLAQSCRSLDALLVAPKDASGLRKLKCGLLDIQKPEHASRIDRCQIEHLLQLRLDLQAHSGRLTRSSIEHLVQTVGRAVAFAQGLQELVLRLATFDDQMDPLRLRPECWDELVLGLAQLAEIQSEEGGLKSLEVSFWPLKLAQLQRLVKLPFDNVMKQDSHLVSQDSLKFVIPQDSLSSPRPSSASASTCASPPGSPEPAASQKRTFQFSWSFLDVLRSLSALEQLSLCYNDLFGLSAQELAGTLRGLNKLSKVDLTRKDRKSVV